MIQTLIYLKGEASEKLSSNGQSPACSVESINSNIDTEKIKLDSDELRLWIDVKCIASEFVEQQKKEMKAVFDFAYENRDAAALRVSILYDQGTKVEGNSKLRPSCKGTYLVTEMFTEVIDIVNGWPLKKNHISSSLQIVEVFRKTNHCFDQQLRTCKQREQPGQEFC